MAKARSGMRKWMWRGVEFIVAATLLLTIAAIHGTILRTSATAFGLRLDTPLILAVQDGCNEPVLIPAAMRAVTKHGAAKRADVQSCSDMAFVTITTPAGRELLLFVNRRFIAAGSGKRRLTTFDVHLRPGSNLITIATEDAHLPFPFAEKHLEPGEEQYQGTIGGPFGDIPRIEGYRSVWIEYGTDAPKTQQWAWEDKKKWSLAMDRPLAVMVDEAGGRRRFGLDGFSLQQLDDSAAIGAPPVFSRHLSLTREADGAVLVEAKACLPADHYLVDWARSDAVDGPEFVARLFGAHVIKWNNRGGDRLWRDSKKVTIGGTTDDCVTLVAEYRVPEGEVSVYPSYQTTFLRLPGDEMVLAGFAQSLEVDGRPPSTSDDGKSVWRSDLPDTQESDGLRIRSSRVLGGPDEARPNPAPAATDGGKPKQKSGLFAAWGALTDVLPGLLKAIAWSLAAAAPVGLMILAMNRHRPEAPFPDQIDRVRASLVAILILMTVVALQPLLFYATQKVLDFIDFAYIIRDPATNSGVGIELYAPLLIVVTIIIGPILTGFDPADASSFAMARIAAAIVSVVVIGTGIAALVLLHALVSLSLSDLLDLAASATFLPSDPWLSALQASSGEQPFAKAGMVGMLVGLWLLVGICTFWLPVYWMTRLAAPRGRLFGTALLAGLAVCFIPLITIGSDGLALAIAFVANNPFVGDSFRVGRFANVIGSPLDLIPIIVVVLVVMLVLIAFRAIVLGMLRPEWVPGVKAWTRWWFLLPLALLIVVPIARTFGSGGYAADIATVRIVGALQDYGLALAMLAPLCAWQALDAAARVGGKSPFDLPPTAITLGAAAFAGNLTLWVEEPLTVAMLMIVGWFVFLYGAIGTETQFSFPAQEGIAARLVAYRAECHLLQQRRKAQEKDFAEGKSSPEELSKQRTVIAGLEGQAKQTLGLLPAEAKRILLELGPRASPLKNGYLAALVGLLAAVTLQFLLQLELPAAQGSSGQSWLTTIGAMLHDPNYQTIAGADDGASQLLRFLKAAINALGLWTVGGFLFGYFFHRIRGDDGFVKAIVFGGAICIPYLLSRALTSGGKGLQLDALVGVVPMLLFILGLGVGLFDGLSLRRHGLAFRNLLDVYGFRTAMGYFSTLGTLAALQPILYVIGQL